MVELSEEWIDKAQAKLANASKGKFFQTTEARLIPTFDRGDDAAAIDDGKSQYITSLLHMSVQPISGLR
eukprot:scaffold3931_cov142-Skeletonema_dohrnii-CCMP3373.AAC.3